MAQTLGGLHFPSDRTLLARTRLAYVNLPGLLSDAKRNRTSRVSGYVAIWLSEGLLLLYLKSGELVNASTDNGKSHGAIPLSDALARVPSAPEWGEISFHEATDEQLACMFTTQCSDELPAPAEIGTEAHELFRQLRDTRFNGLIEITVDDNVNYLIFEDGRAAKGYLADGGGAPLFERAARISTASRSPANRVRCFAIMAELPVQAPPQLICAYRDLAEALVKKLTFAGRTSAPAIAEHARVSLLNKHPSLAGFAADAAEQFDPVCTAAELSRSIAAWVTETIWAGHDIETASPEDILRSIAAERRHMFQSAGLFDHIPWKIEW